MEKGKIDLSEAEKKRTGYIEGREDLFATKLFEVQDGDEKTEKSYEKEILVIARNPGAGSALLPVVQEMGREGGFHTFLLTDGRAEETLKNKLNLEDKTPGLGAMDSAAVIGEPDIVLIDPSASEQGIEIYATANFPDSPTVLVEDYYSSTHKFLKTVRERKLRPPDRICVLDAEAKAMIIKSFPEFADRVEVTGQPAFDRFASEETEKIAREVKKSFGLKTEDKLVVFMATWQMNLLAAEKLAQELAKINTESYFVFRKHPRDNTPIEEYNIIFKAHSLKLIDSAKFSTDQVAAAADMIVTTTSTEGLNGIYRRKPTIHITDENMLPMSENLDITLPLPVVKLGASVGINDVKELSGSVDSLLGPDRAVYEQLKGNMEKYYPKDGKNSARVVSVINEVLELNK